MSESIVSTLIVNDLKKQNRNVTVRDRSGSIFKDEIESNYSQEDWDYYNKVVVGKSSINGTQANESANRWLESIRR